MSDELEGAVNALLSKPDIVKDKDFINLMGVIHEQLSIVDCHLPFNKDELIAVQCAVGEFVPTDGEPS